MRGVAIDGRVLRDERIDVGDRHQNRDRAGASAAPPTADPDRASRRCRWSTTRDRADRAGGREEPRRGAGRPGLVRRRRNQARNRGRAWPAARSAGGTHAVRASDNCSGSQILSAGRWPGSRRPPRPPCLERFGVSLLDGLLLIAVLDLPADLAARPLGRVHVRVRVAGTDRLDELLERPRFDSPVGDAGEYISGRDLAGDGALDRRTRRLASSAAEERMDAPLTER